MNLAEFPLTVLSTRSNQSLKTLEFSDSVHDRNGKVMRRHWIVTGADKFGLPTSSDDEVLLGLLKFTLDHQFTDRKIFFTRYELLKVLRWTTEGRSYRRLQNALDRLSGVRIKATNAFYDNESKAHSTRNFGVIDAYELNHGGESNSKPSFFVWSDVLFKSFKVGFIKKLDLDFYFQLKSAVSKRLYRYLDKHFWYKSKVQLNLFTLAHEKVGISRNYKFASSLKQQIDPAIEELIQAGFLSSREYLGKGSATEVVLYAAQKTPRVKSSSRHDSAIELESEGVLTARDGQGNSPVSSDDHIVMQAPEVALEEKLVARGIRRPQAGRLLAARGPAELKRIEAIIEYFDSLLIRGSSLISRSPAGFLYRAVENPGKFMLPGEGNKEGRGEKAAQASLSFTKKVVATAKAADSSAKHELESHYLVARRQEVVRLKETIEPDMLERITDGVKVALVKLKGLISEARFEEAVSHGVEEKLLRLFAFPEFDVWCQEQKDLR